LCRYNLERVQQERDKGTMEFEETKRQLEEDADREIEELKAGKYLLINRSTYRYRVKPFYLSSETVLPIE
jgi:hypothetical protein